MSTRKAFTPQDLRELAAEPLDVFHPHLLDAMRGALRFCADVIDAANEALRDQTALQAKEAEIAALKEDAERLAWLDKNPGRIKHSIGYRGAPDSWVWTDSSGYGHDAANLSAAIDSAQAAGDGERKL